MKRLLSARLLSTLLLGLFAVNTWASLTTQVDGIWYYILDTYKSKYCSVVAPQSGSYEGKVDIPNKITLTNGKEYVVSDIDKYAFKNQTALTSVVIGDSIQFISDEAFAGCTQLKSVTFNNKVTWIGNGAFGGCQSLEYANLPSTVTTIANSAFAYCTSLKKVTIPSGIKNLSYATFGDASVDTLIINSTELKLYDKVFERFNCKLVYANSSVIPTLRQAMNGRYIAEIGKPFILEDIKCQPRSVTFKVASSLYDDAHAKLTRIVCDGMTLTPQDDGSYLYKGLKPTQDVGIDIYYTDDKYTQETSFGTSLQASEQEFELSKIWDGPSNTSIRYKVKVIPDDNYTVEEIGLMLDEQYYPGYYEVDQQTQKVSIDGLVPGTSYTFYPYVKYADGNIYTGKSENSWTSSVQPDMTKVSVGPTSYCYKGGVYLDGAHVKARWFSIDNVENSDDSLVVKRQDLEPETSYVLRYVVYTKEGDKKFISNATKVTLPAPTLETQQAKAISETAVMLSANTNLETTVTRAGFEWRRYDAPDELPSNKVTCAVIDNQLMGSLRNLKSEIYYKYRPYYTTAAGKSYYGDWIAFIAGDAYVYFEPVTRTYAVGEITENTAQVSGAVVAGTDNITEQGFEYWKSIALQTRAIGSDVKTVKASGQMMTATLSGLEPGTQYSYRVYAKTANGTTYGAEQQFTTGGTPTAINQVDSDVTEKICVKGNLNKDFSLLTNGEATWEILDINGKTVDRGSIAAGGTWTPIHHRPLARGIYLVHITTKHATKTSKQIAK